MCDELLHFNGRQIGIRVRVWTTNGSIIGSTIFIIVHMEGCMSGRVNATKFLWSKFFCLKGIWFLIWASDFDVSTCDCLLTDLLFDW